jgi:hypothetical protein
MNIPNETLPTKLLKITERFYGTVFYTSHQDIERANRLNLPMVRCRCRNGRLVSHYYAEMGWSQKTGAVVHRSYLDGAAIEEVDAI